jgi:phage anti-repressor protein
MQDLIKINYENNSPTVSARELHQFLKSETDFRHWFPRMTEYGFKTNIDYTPVIFEHPQNRQPTADYAMTLDMAKEICMIQRTDKGKEARQYFIRIEKEYRTKILPKDYLSALKALIAAEETKQRLLAENDILETALNESLTFYTVAKYNNTFKMGWNLNKCQEIGKRLSTYCRANSIEIRKCKTNDERFGDVHSYPLTAWEDFFRTKNRV